MSLTRDGSKASLPARMGWFNVGFVAFLIACLLLVLISGAGRGMRYSVIGGMSLWVTGAAGYLACSLGALVLAWAKGWPRRKPVIGLCLAALSLAVAWPLSFALVHVVEAVHYGW